MKASDILRAAAVPATNQSVLLTLIMFWLMLSLAAAARSLGIWLAIVILPALFRYLNSMVEEIGSGREPKSPGTEFFRWIGETWSLFPLLIVVALALASHFLHSSVGVAAVVVLLVVAGTLYPAILGVLAITHSPLQSVNPNALINFIGGIGTAYLIAPIFLLLAVFLSSVTQSVPYVALLIQLFLIFSLHAVIGRLIEPHKLFDDVFIADRLEASEDELAADLEQSRNAVLTHAYAFASRGNRDGGFKHIADWIDQDPDTVRAWAWFLERMLRWEEKQHALFFAQHYIHDMLQHGETVPALKTIMRCRLVDDSFKPLKEDIPRAIEAATSSGNIELATVLKRA